MSRRAFLLGALVLPTGAAGCAAGRARTSATAPPAGATSGAGARSFLDATALHALTLEIDPDDYTEMITAYTAGGEKEWVRATATIDGTVLQDVGVRLKGNLTLRSVDLDTDPSAVPFLLKTDQFVEGQDVGGYTRFAVRSSTSKASLNEALALDLLTAAGLASAKAVESAFTVNGSPQRLRLVVQDLDETWETEHFSTPGMLYKAEAGGDYSYRGDDPEAYVEAFDQKTGDDDLTPVIALLKFLDEATDEEVARELPSRVDVQAFAAYVALEALMANADDIEGGGNNSYLRYDSSAKRFTVVAWDHNSAFGGGIGPGGARLGGRQGRGRHGEVGAAGPGTGSRINALLQRFQAVPAFAALIAQSSSDLRVALYDSGVAQRALDRWVTLLRDQAVALISTDDLTGEATEVSGFLRTS